jgi:hypothetical protein
MTRSGRRGNRRSWQFWMIGILHGLGDFFIDGLPVLLGASIRA